MPRPRPKPNPDAAPPIRETRRLVRYEDLNAHGTLFGGRLAMWIDEACAIYAVCQMNQMRVVTVRISELTFRYPIHLHDILEFRCSTIREGRTSITILCEVVRLFTRKPTRVAHAELAFVSVSKQGKPIVWTKPGTKLK